MRLLAFGGPLNEQMVAVDGDRVLAPLPWARRGESIRDMAFRAEYEELLGPRPDEIRTVTYTVEKVGFHDTTRCLPPIHSDECYWETRCLIAEGFPKHRITDALNALAAMSGLLSTPPTTPVPPQGEKP